MNPASGHPLRPLVPAERRRPDGRAPLAVGFILLVIALSLPRTTNGFALFYLASFLFALWGLGSAQGTIQKALGIALCGIIGAGAIVIACIAIGVE